MRPPFPFELSDQCVKCGLCLPHCPTYQLSGSESEGPRGRIAIMESVAAATIPLTRGAVEHLGNCLGCGRCEQVCPAKVAYLEIRDHHRARQLTTWQRGFLWLLSRGQSADWHRLLSVLQYLTGWIPARMFPARTRAARRLLATQTHAPREARHSEGSHPGVDANAQLFRGCVASGLDARAQTAAATVLAQLDPPVRPAPNAQCCGALAQHAGAIDLAQQQRDLLTAQTIPLVALDSGCIADLRRSGRSVTEACRYVLDHWPAHWQPLLPAQAVALHLPCTHRNGCGDTDAVTHLLARIQGLQVVTIRGLGCCGAGGTHLLERPDHAAEFAHKLLAEIPPGVTQLASTNVGCRSHLRAMAPQLRVVHPLELLLDALSHTQSDAP